MVETLEQCTELTIVAVILSKLVSRTYLRERKAYPHCICEYLDPIVRLVVVGGVWFIVRKIEDACRYVETKLKHLHDGVASG